MLLAGAWVPKGPAVAVAWFVPTRSLEGDRQVWNHRKRVHTGLARERPIDGSA